MEDEKEVWKVITGFSAYECSTLGRIKHTRTNRIFTLNQIHRKYIQVNLISDDGDYKYLTLHRVIAKTFISNPENKSQVNHKDKNKCNNRVSNLEWMTPKENVRHSIQNRDINPAIGRKYEKKLASDDFVSVKIEGYEHYKINIEGEILSKTGRIITGTSDSSGYIRVTMQSDSNVNLATAKHRVVARTFLPNPENKPYINHKNGIRDDNRVENLEWVTQKENVTHAHKNGLIKTSSGRPVYQLELNGIIIKEWRSIKEAEEKFSNNTTSISSVCSNYNRDNIDAGYKTFAGYGWCWKESYEENRINPMLKNIFPEIDYTDPEINYEKLRYYVIRGWKPIWQLELDGTRLIFWENMIDIGISNIFYAIKNNTTANGYGWSYASYRDVCIENNPYEKNSSIISALEPEIDFSREIDFDLIMESVKKAGWCKPVWEINKDGYRIKKWSGKSEAMHHYNIGRNLIDQVCIGRVTIAGDRLWEFATIYKDDNTDEKSYRVIPYTERVYIKGRKSRTRMIDQYDLEGNLIKTWDNPKTLYEETKISLSLSYFSQSGYVFKVRNELKKLNRHKIVQMTLDNKVVKIWDDTIENIAKTLNGHRTSIGNCLLGHNKTGYGFKWKYYE